VVEVGNLELVIGRAGGFEIGALKSACRNIDACWR
jgi:hypothetical protein